MARNIDVSNPAKIAIREKALGIIDKYMRTDEQTRIQYASKFARVANYWKKWIGEKLGMELGLLLGKVLGDKVGEALGEELG